MLNDELTESLRKEQIYIQQSLEDPNNPSMLISGDLLIAEETAKQLAQLLGEAAEEIESLRRKLQPQKTTYAKSASELAVINARRAKTGSSATLKNKEKFMPTINCPVSVGDRFYRIRPGMTIPDRLEVLEVISKDEYPLIRAQYIYHHIGPVQDRLFSAMIFQDENWIVEKKGADF